MSGTTRIRETPIELSEVVAEVARAGAGGIAIFAGTVRDENDGRAVTLLEYQAYASMAEKEIQAIIDELSAELPGCQLAVLHRVGSLAVGDTAVLCAASSAHRAEAFQACRELIDRIKERVPIWKREHGPEGPYWVGWEDARCSSHHGHSPAK